MHQYEAKGVELLPLRRGEQDGNPNAVQARMALLDVVGQALLPPEAEDLRLWNGSTCCPRLVPSLPMPSVPGVRRERAMPVYVVLSCSAASMILPGYRVIGHSSAVRE